jgi:hypothetical protein
MKGLVPGRIVNFVISDIIAGEINRKRAASLRSVVNVTIPTHIGNLTKEGDIFPMMVIKVWNDFGEINGQVFLDGNDTYWAQSIIYSHQDEPLPGTWHWIEKQ